MSAPRLFIRSVQKEFSVERTALRDYRRAPHGSVPHNLLFTIPEMAKRLKRTERTVERLLNKLKADEIIGRVGPRKGGYWEVLK